MNSQGKRIFLATADRGTTVRRPAVTMRVATILALACATFFMRFLALAVYAPYLILWLTHAGHSTTSAAAVLILSRIMSFFAPPLLGGFADVRRCHREAFLATSLVNGAAVAAATVFPASLPWQSACFALAALSDPSSLVDAMVMRSLAWAGRRDLASRSRACGAISWCAAGPVVGILAREYGVALLFQIYPLLVLLNLPAVALLPTRRAYAPQAHTSAPPSSTCTAAANAADASAADDATAPDAADAAAASATSEPPPTPAPAPPTPPPASFWSRARLVFRSPPTLVRLVLVLLCGMHFGIGFAYGFLFLEDELGASGLQLGLSLTSQALLEVPLPTWPYLRFDRT